MKTIRIFGTRGLIPILAAAFGVSVGFAAPAFALTLVDTAFIVNPDGKVTYLGTLGGRYAGATGINHAGQVVGYSNTKEDSPFGGQVKHAYITGPNGVGMIDLGTLGGDNYSEATGINDVGQVVGVSYSAGEQPLHAFITGPNGKGMTDLGTLGGDNSSEATGINDAGQVVGFSYSAGGPLHAFITGPNGKGMTDLGTLGGTTSFASGINDAGQVVGFSHTGEFDHAGNQALHAFITGPDGKEMTDLGTLGGLSSYATDINDAGQVVGFSDTKELQDGFPVHHAFITGPDGKGMTDLGTLGGVNSSARSINDAGQVVGGSDTKELADQYGNQAVHAFITGPNGVGMIDINSYADFSDDYYLTSADEINNRGQVIGTLVIPEPASYALMLAGLGLVGFMARGKRVADNSVARG